MNLKGSRGGNFFFYYFFLHQIVFIVLYFVTPESHKKRNKLAEYEVAVLFEERIEKRREVSKILRVY